MRRNFHGTRDKDIQHVFEVADDSLQGILGYHLYVVAMQSASNFEKISEYLPEGGFPMTFSWGRYYQKRDLVQAFDPPVLQFYQSRISLTSLVTAFEVALTGFIDNLSKKGYALQLKNQKLFAYIKWAYEQLSCCDIGDPEAIKRLPVTLGIIDNARRLRNLIIHNQGLFNERYETDVLKIRDIKVDMHPGYTLFKVNKQNSIPVLLDTKYFLRFSKAHIEVLHLLHNQIQKRYFGYDRAYDYRAENKPIEWNKALWGSTNTVFYPIKKSTIS